MAILRKRTRKLATVCPKWEWETQPADCDLCTSSACVEGCGLRGDLVRERFGRGRGIKSGNIIPRLHRRSIHTQGMHLQLIFQDNTESLLELNLLKGRFHPFIRNLSEYPMIAKHYVCYRFFFTAVTSLTKVLHKALQWDPGWANTRHTCGKQHSNSQSLLHNTGYCGKWTPAQKCPHCWFKKETDYKICRGEE